MVEKLNGGKALELVMVEKLVISIPQLLLHRMDIMTSLIFSSCMALCLVHGPR